MAVPLCGELSGGVWWSWHYRLQRLAYEGQFGEEAENVFAALEEEVVKEMPDGHSEDYCVAMKLRGHYKETRNYYPPNTLVATVRLRYVEDLKRHAWTATTVMFTRWSQCREVRTGAQSAEEHFRVSRIARREYV